MFKVYDNNTIQWNSFDWNQYPEIWKRLSLIDDFKVNNHILCSVAQMHQHVNTKIDGDETKWLVSSTYYMANPFVSWDINKLSQRLHIMGFESVVIWNITNDKPYNQEISYGKIEANDGTPCELIIVSITMSQLFENETFSELFLKSSKHRTVNHYLYFNNFSWLEVISMFRKNKIILSGGSNTKRHLLSTTEYRLAQFIACHDGARISNVSQSFYDEGSKAVRDFYITTRNKIAAGDKTKELKELTFNVNRTNLDLTLPSVPDYNNQKMDSFSSFNETRERENKLRFGVSLSNAKLEELKTNLDKENLSSNSLDKNNLNLDMSNRKDLIKKNKNSDEVFADVKESGKDNSGSKLVSEIKNTKLNSNGISNVRNYHTKCQFVQNKSVRMYSTNNNNIDKGLVVSSKTTTKYSLNSSSLDDEGKNNYIFSYLNKLDDYFKEFNRLKNNMSEEDQIKYLRAIQLRVEENWVDEVRDIILNSDSKSNLLNSKIYLAYESWKNFMSDKKQYKKFLRIVKDEQILNLLQGIENMIIAFSFVITYHKMRSYTSIAQMISSQCLFQVFKKIRVNDEYKNLSFKEFLAIKHLEIEELTEMGVYILEMFISRDVFIKKYYLNETPYLVLNEITMGEVVNNLVIHPSSLPMIVKPNDWSDYNFGGNLSNLDEKIGLIGGNFSKHNHDVKNKDNLFKSVNYLNGIKFRINTDLLDYISNEGSFLLGNLPGESLKDMDKSELEAYKSLQLQNEITLKIAHTFRNMDYYLNVNADWRGRLYTNSFWVSYQGNDLSSALVYFKEGEIITENGRDYFYIYGANLYNEDKVSKKPYKARIAWVKKNLPKILKMDQLFILGAEDPILFASFCLIMRKLESDSNTKVQLPVFLDATCSGIQHLAGLILDYELGSRVNLIAQTEDTPVGDIYSELLNPINKAINEYGEINKDFAELADIIFDRSILKISIMTIVYNVTNYGIATQLQNKLEKISELVKDKNGNEFEVEKFKVPTKEGGFAILNKAHLFKIAKIINEQIFIVFPKLKEIYNYFINVTKILVLIGLPIVWFTPLGLEIQQRYLQSEKHKVTISLRGKSKVITLQKFKKGTIDSRKQSSAIVPNIVHTMDAQQLMLVIIHAIEEGFGPLVCVHDCFGTLPNRMSDLELSVKKAFIELYTDQKYLKKFHANFINILKLNNISIIEVKPKDKDRWVDSLDASNEGYFLSKTKNYFIIELNITQKNRTKTLRYELPSFPKGGDLILEDVLKSKYIIT